MKLKRFRKIIGILFVLAMMINIMPVISISADDEELDTYTVQYDANGDDNDVDLSSFTTSYNDGDVVIVKDFVDEEIVLTKDGISISSWNTKEDGSGDNYDLLSEFEIHENIKLYAQYNTSTDNDSKGGSFALGLSDDVHEHDGISFTAWESSNSMPSTPGSYYLTSDVILHDTWDILDGEYNLCLNGKNMTVDGILGAIRIEKPAILNLYDAEGSGKITNTLTGYRYLSGGLYVYGEFNMYGGRISGNDSYYAGGIYVDRGKFKMYSGSIDDNVGNNAGGVFIADGEIGLYGGKIINNKSESFCGGVLVSQNSTIEISGDVMITGNTNDGSDSNLYVYGYNKLKLAGPLTNSVPIGIYRSDPGLFTKGSTEQLKASDYRKKFKSDRKDLVIKKLDNELRMLNGFSVSVPYDAVNINTTTNEENITLVLVIEEVEAKDVSDNDLRLSNTYMNDNDITLGQYYDVSVYFDDEPISMLNYAINVTLDVPQEIRNAPDGYDRLFTVFRIHDEKAEKMKDSYDTSISFDTDSFSTYVIAYRDIAKHKEIKPEDNNKHYSIPTTGIDH